MMRRSSSLSSRALIVSRALLALLLAATAAGLTLAVANEEDEKVPFGLALLWPEAQRAFLQDGPGLLLSDRQLESLVNRDAIGREQFIVEFLSNDPLPETPENELAVGIERRRALVEQEFLTYLDDRAKLLFLAGAPDHRLVIDCAETFKPLEIWSYRKPPDVPGQDLARRLEPSVTERRAQAQEREEEEERRQRRIANPTRDAIRNRNNPLPPARPIYDFNYSKAAEFPLENYRHLVLYRSKPRAPYRLWLPIDSKRELYNPEMEYWLEQWEELRSRIRGGKRFDRTICDQSLIVDMVTGVDGLFGFQPKRPKNAELQLFLQPPDDLAGWARAAAATEIDPARSLGAGELELAFPERHGQRMLVRGVVTLPPEVEIEPFVEGDSRELRLRIEGSLEREAKLFEQFRVRFQLPVPEDGEAAPLALVFNRRLRPREEFLMRIKVIEEVSGRELVLHRGFAVPTEPTAAPEIEVTQGTMVALGEELQRQRIAGYDSLILVPPESDIVFGLWRAEALVTGERIQSVAFSLDEKIQMTRRRPPFTAELRLATYPKEQIVRAEGFDDDGELVAGDEVVLNQPRGELRVRIVEPARGKTARGEVMASAEVVVPEEKQVVEVRFLLNDELQATLERPPWETKIAVPPGQELVYLTVQAELNDGTAAEDVRFLNAPDYIEEVDVNLVELYTTVTDKNGLLIPGLTADEFQVWEDGRPQKIAKFELVEDLPLTLGITIDTSGSMFESLGEAQRAAVGFLENIITNRDRCFAVAFSDRPELLMPRTSDVGAVAARLEDLVANGSTSLHDAIVTSLYYYRGIKGRRALILLSDGEDTSSSLSYAEALEYAKRSGVSVYTIGLKIGGRLSGVRRKLETLSQETGGRTFYIKEASELFEVYDEIERELRSQYLVAYNSDQPSESGQYHEVEVKVRDGKLKARTVRGYYG